MPLLDRDGWREDAYVLVDQWTEAPAIIVPRQALDEALARRTEGQRIGLTLPPDCEPSALPDDTSGLDLVRVEFPGMVDGRGFSIARKLRGNCFSGTLRAAGELIPDQFDFALRCGFIEIEISAERAARQPIEQWLAAVSAYGLAYQGAGSILEKRAARRAA
ncbi:MAG: DUF934 domain-containing protein [Parasphingopyxis sp.]|nr:DUF934 domain-containing protein [Sphingomonadales bacterium]